MLLKIDQRPRHIAHRPVRANTDMVHADQSDEVIHMIEHMLDRRITRIAVDEPRHRKYANNASCCSDGYELFIAFAALMVINRLNTRMRSNHWRRRKPTRVQRRLFAAMARIDDDA
ncbi:hypothetical protein D3C85_1472660 [compost metagenome]